MLTELNKFLGEINKDRIRSFLAWCLVSVLIVLIWSIIPREFWQYIFFMRVPILSGVFLITLPTIATTLLRSMLKNLFVLRGKWQLTFVIIGAIIAGMAIILTANTILVNAPARFGVPSPFKIPDWLQYGLAIFLGFWTCFTATKLSLEEEELTPKQALQAVLLGGGISIGMLCLVSLFRQWLRSQVFLLPTVIKIIEVVTKHRPDGYLIETAQGRELSPGHLATVAFILVELLVYLIIFFLFQPPKVPAPNKTNKPQKRREASALLYLLLIISVFVLLLGGLSFYLDFFRIPTLVFSVIIFAFSYWFFAVDHFYQLYPDSMTNKNDCKELCDFKKVLDKRLEFQNNKKTLVVVCASGGGIQAAGWTAQVLTGLQQLPELGESFTKSIGFISSVSGGTVGSMYYLDGFEDSTGCPPQDPKELEKIFQRATADSLDATGWGLAYPDLWRLISIPWLSPKMLDRGIALERDWQQEMKNPGKLTTLATWREKILDGKLPIPIFNATLVENGKRFLISPMNFNDVQIKDGSATEDIVNDFNYLYGDYDLAVISGARLSATFPYVSPICRNTTEKNVNKNFHVADGGYFDNSGFVTILEWLNKWLNPQKELNLKRVIILQINPFPKSPPTDRVEGSKGWFMTTIGPVLAILKVRDPVSVQRNTEEVQIFKKRWESQGIEIDYYPIFFPILTEESNKMQKTPFYNEQQRYEPPLSWKLTQREKEAIHKAWKTIEKTDSIPDDDPNKAIKEIIKQLKDKWETVKKEWQ